MKNEHVFNVGGFYSFVARSDALLHSGTVTVGREFIGEFLRICANTFGDATVTTTSCSQPTGYVSDDTDCDDTSAVAFPGNSEGATECGDGIDQDCSGADLACTSTTDVDGDGITEADGDCDDSDSTVYPGATELGDAIDNDCDDRIDEGLVAANISSFPSSAAAGDSIDIDYDITNNSGLTEFEVEVLINNDVVGARETPRPSRAVVISNVCVASRCNELNSEDTTATLGGATTSDTISATIPSGTAAGDYTLRIRIRDASTGQYFTRDLETITIY